MKYSLLKRCAAMVAVCAICLTGCGGAAGEKLTPASPTSLEIWHYYNGPQKLAFDQLVAEFNETAGREQGIIVEAFNQGSVGELAGKMRDAMEKKVGAEKLPNIFATYPDSAFELDKNGLLIPLDAYFTDEERDSFVKSFLDEGRFDETGSLKIIPTAKALEIMMINLTDWEPFAKATGADWKQLTTIEQITETARAFYLWTDAQTLTPDDGHAFFGRDAMANYMLAGYRGITGRDLIAKGEIPSETVDRTALRRLWDNYYVPYINGWFDAVGRFRSDDVKTGDLIALVGSTSGALYFPEQVMMSDTVSYPIEAGVLPVPVFEGAQSCNVQQGAGMAVVKSNPKTEKAAIVFLKWFTEPDRNAAFAASSGYLPVRTAANDMELIHRAFTGEGTVSKNLDAVFSSAIETVKTEQLYVAPPFHGAANARKILSNSMSDHAKADRDRVNALVAQGMSRADAAARFATDQTFEQWQTELLTQLDAALAG